MLVKKPGESLVKLFYHSPVNRRCNEFIQFPTLMFMSNGLWSEGHPHMHMDPVNVGRLSICYPAGGVMPTVIPIRMFIRRAYGSSPLSLCMGNGNLLSWFLRPLICKGETGRAVNLIIRLREEEKRRGGNFSLNCEKH